MLEDLTVVNGVAFANVFNAKGIDNEGEYNRLLLVNPEARCCGRFVVVGFVEACGEEVVDKLASLGKAVDTFANFKIDLEITGFVSKVVFLDKVFGNIGETDVHIFVAVERAVQVEIDNVETGELCITARDEVVENKFCKFK